MADKSMMLLCASFSIIIASAIGQFSESPRYQTTAYAKNVGEGVYRHAAVSTDGPYCAPIGK